MAVTRKSQPQARRERLLSLLADGEFHSGEQLARRLRISRGGVWKLVHTLEALGVQIQSLARQGYKLPYAVNLLDADEILESIDAAARERIARIEVLLTVDSTNRHVYESNVVAPGRAHLCLAEIQSAGRGRRGLFDDQPPLDHALLDGLAGKLGHRKVDRDEAAYHGGKRTRHQDPRPGLAVPGLDGMRRVGGFEGDVCSVHEMSL